MSTAPNIPHRAAIENQKRVPAHKAFQRLWVAGTLGAFFSALARSFPLDVWQLRHSFNWELALNDTLRYGYMIWLIWYFFISNIRSQSDEARGRHMVTREVAYDVVQSLFGLSAAFYLDFLVVNGHHGTRSYMAPNIAIFVICFLAYIWFGEDKSLQSARRMGALIAGGSAVAVLFIPKNPWWAVSVLFIPLVLLVWPVWKFHRVRLTKNQEENKATFNAG